jgi:flagellar protein FlgJ
MTISGFDPKAATSTAEAKDLVQFKREMDSLKGRLSDDSTKEEKLKGACKKFEAIFMGKIWKEMRKTVSKSGYLKSNYEDQYLSMFDKDFSEKLASGGGIGLGDMLYQQLRTKLEDASRETLPGTGNATAPKTLDDIHAKETAKGMPLHKEAAEAGPGIPLPKPGIELDSSEFGVGGPVLRNMVKARAQAAAENSGSEVKAKENSESSGHKFLSRHEAMAKVDELARKIEKEHDQTVYGIGITADQIGKKLASSI